MSTQFMTFISLKKMSQRPGFMYIKWVVPPSNIQGISGPTEVFLITPLEQHCYLC